MQLVLGSHVRDGGRRVGRLAGFELEPADLRIRRIIFSADGELGPQVRSQPVEATPVSAPARTPKTHQQTTADGKARYGEAVVREILGASFIEEQSLRPASAPAPLDSPEA